MRSTLKSICAFCGSSPGTSSAIIEAACELGALLAARDITLVNGGGGRGVMAALADATLAGGGRVVGVMPRYMVEREWAHANLTELHLVDTMHERKARMADLAEAFIALPGGIGTLDELFEIWTWWQIGLHAKPIGLLNVDGFYDKLLSFVDHQIAVEFLAPEHRAGLIVSTDVGDLLNRIVLSA